MREKRRLMLDFSTEYDGRVCSSQCDLIGHGERRGELMCDAFGRIARDEYEMPIRPRACFAAEAAMDAALKSAAGTRDTAVRMVRR